MEFKYIIRGILIGQYVLALIFSLFISVFFVFRYQIQPHSELHKTENSKSKHIIAIGFGFIVFFSCLIDGTMEYIDLPLSYRSYLYIAAFCLIDYALLQMCGYQYHNWQIEKK